MAQMKYTSSTKFITSDINMLLESKLNIDSVCTDDKCRLASAMLKKDYESKKHLPFLDLVDYRLLIKLTIPELKVKIENSYFSEKERSFLLEARRKYKNRESANKSRMQHDIDISALQDQLDNLECTRNALKREKQKLVQEIQLYSADLFAAPY